MNAVYLKDHGWYRIDPQGNKPGGDAAFCPPKERLAFPILRPEEPDLPEIWPEPLPVMVKVLSECKTVQQVFDNLPDIWLF